MPNQNKEGFGIVFGKKRKKTKQEKQSVSKRKIIFSIATIFIVFFSAFSVHFLLQFLFNTQYPVVIVISNSMEPIIKRGDLLFVKGIDPEDIKEGTIEDKKGDVVVFNAHGLWDDAPEEPVVHRVVSKWFNDTTQKWYFYTKGDANFHIDMAIISEDRIYGVVFGGIPYIGMIKIVLVDSGLYIFIIIFLITLIIISLIRDILKDEKQKKKNINLNPSTTTDDEKLIKSKLNES